MGDETGMYPPDGAGAGVAAIIFSGETLLMIKRKGSHGAGTWSVPGGWIDYGESPAKAAEREVKEEVGISVDVIRFLTATNWIFWQDEVQSVCLWYLCRAKSVAATNCEPEKIEEVAWIPYQQIEEDRIDRIPLFPHLIEFMHQYEEDITVKGLRAAHAVLRGGRL